jgi:SnoaL-like protein
MPVQITDRDEKLRVMVPGGWTPELFAVYWSAPSARYLREMVTDDVVGHWPGAGTVRGSEDYIAALERLMTALPDLRLEVHDSAVNGEVAFVRWVMHATGVDGPFTMGGVDCVHTRGGRVCENFINFNGAELAGHLGRN